MLLNIIATETNPSRSPMFHLCKNMFTYHTGIFCIVNPVLAREIHAPYLLPKDRPQVCVKQLLDSPGNLST